MKNRELPSVKKLARYLDSDDQVRMYQARQGLSTLEVALGEPRNDDDRQKVCDKIVELLKKTKQVVDGHKANEKPHNGPAYSAQARNQLMRTLAGIGGDSEVPALEAALDDFEVREIARWALDRMQSDEATEVLADAATKKVGDEFRIGVINSLGRKPTSENVLNALKKCAADNEPEVRLAAAEALANHADPSVDKVIAGVAKGATVANSRRTKLRIAKARMRLAELLAKKGDKDAAQDIYKSLASDGAEDAQKRAANLARDKRG